ncbi:MAG: replication restart helicase PriA [Acidobacteriota bacterium]
MYVRVVLPLALPGALTYSVPDTFEGLVAPGTRVRVRVRGTSRVGLVVGSCEDPGCDPALVVDVDEVLDEEPLVPAHVLDLIAFAAEYYVAPIGTVVRAALPPQVLKVPPPMLRAGPRAREVLAHVAGHERRLLERVLDSGRITLARLRSEGWGSGDLRRAVAALADRLALRVEERKGLLHPHGTVQAVELVELSGAERTARIGRAPAQRRAVAWLEEAGRPVLESDLAAACGCTRAVVASLVEKGVVRRFPQARSVPGRRWELVAPPPPPRLSVHQREAVERMAAALGKGTFAPALLRGVTGSGKTEVYLRLAAEAAVAGLGTVVLVPEIALTPALAGQLAARFGGRVAVLHSSMSDGDRFAAWERVRRGVDVVAGPRSALWAPLPRLGLVVVDEEQDSSYKQDEEPRYNARDLALVLGRRLGIPVLLASATPSLEVLLLARRGRLGTHDLPERVAGGRLPEIQVVDLREEPPEPGEHGQRFLSRHLRGLLGETVAREEQAILLVNRRGWAPVLLCRECGHQAACPNCSIPLTIHKRRHELACHYCGHSEAIPSACPRCGGEVLEHVGAGTEKIAELAKALIPHARVDILDRDTARSPAGLVATLERFGGGETDVLVGTQMVSKGHHFPRVTLTGVVNADNLLGYPDFRGAERTFQMLTQVAGRAGRGERPGTVVIQTYHPDHHAVRAALGHDLDGFLEEELGYRRTFRYPPFARLAVVRFEAESERLAHASADAAVRAIRSGQTGLRTLGPTAAPIARLRGRWRVHVLLLAPARQPLREALAAVASVPVARGVHRVIDVDPQNTV